MARMVIAGYRIYRIRNASGVALSPEARARAGGSLADNRGAQ